MDAWSRSKPMYSGEITTPTISKVSQASVSVTFSELFGAFSVIFSPILNVSGAPIFTSTAHSFFAVGSLPSCKTGTFRSFTPPLSTFEFIEMALRTTLR